MDRDHQGGKIFCKVGYIIMSNHRRNGNSHWLNTLNSPVFLSLLARNQIKCTSVLFTILPVDKHIVNISGVSLHVNPGYQWWLFNGLLAKGPLSLDRQSKKVVHLSLFCSSTACGVKYQLFTKSTMSLIFVILPSNTSICHVSQILLLSRLSAHNGFARHVLHLQKQTIWHYWMS